MFNRCIIRWEPFHHIRLLVFKMLVFPQTFVLCIIITYVSSCSFLLFSWSVAFNFSCSTLRRSCSSIIFWFWLSTESKYYIKWTCQTGHSVKQHKLERHCWRKASPLPSYHTMFLYWHSPGTFSTTKLTTSTYSWSSVISFSFASTSSLRLLICFWCVSRWLWICCSTACYWEKQYVLYALRSCHTSFYFS